MTVTALQTKSAIHMWTHKLAVQLGDDWTVCPIHPGYAFTMVSSQNDQLTEGLSPDTSRRR